MMPAHAAIAHRPLVFSASTNLQHCIAVKDRPCSAGRADNCRSAGLRRQGKAGGGLTDAAVSGMAKQGAMWHHTLRGA